MILDYFECEQLENSLGDSGLFILCIVLVLQIPLTHYCLPISVSMLAVEFEQQGFKQKESSEVQG